MPRNVNIDAGFPQVITFVMETNSVCICNVRVSLVGYILNYVC